MKKALANLLLMALILLMAASASADVKTEVFDGVTLKLPGDAVVEEDFELRAFYDAEAALVTIEGMSPIRLLLLPADGVQPDS